MRDDQLRYLVEAVQKGLDWVNSSSVGVEYLPLFADEAFFRDMFLNRHGKKPNFAVDQWRQLLLKKLYDTDQLSFDLDITKTDFISRMSTCSDYDILLGLIYLRQKHGLRTRCYIDDLIRITKECSRYLFGFLHLYDLMFTFFLEKLGIEVPFSELNHCDNEPCGIPADVRLMLNYYLATHRILIKSDFLEKELAVGENLNDMIQELTTAADWAMNLGYGDLSGEIALCFSMCGLREQLIFERIIDYLLQTQGADGAWNFAGYSLRENRHATYVAILALAECTCPSG